MAIYKVSYICNKSYSQQGEFYIDNVYDEHDAVEVGIYKYNLGEDVTISNIELVCE